MELDLPIIQIRNCLLVSIQAGLEKLELLQR
jgi:hypothetical protein